MKRLAEGKARKTQLFLIDFSGAPGTGLVRALKLLESLGEMSGKARLKLFKVNYSEFK